MNSQRDSETEGVKRGTPALPLKVIASRIYAHLRRWEADKTINKKTNSSGTGLPNYYMAGAHVAGRFVGVRYINFQGTTNLTRKHAAHYLDMIEAGYVGRHWEAFRKSPPPL